MVKVLYKFIVDYILYCAFYSAVCSCLHFITCLNIHLLPFHFPMSFPSPVSGTFKIQKTRLQREGYDPRLTNDRIYFLNSRAGCYEVVNEELYSSILKGRISLWEQLTDRGRVDWLTPPVNAHHSLHSLSWEDEASRGLWKILDWGSYCCIRSSVLVLWLNFGETGLSQWGADWWPQTWLLTSLT